MRRIVFLIVFLAGLAAPVGAQQVWHGGFFGGGRGGVDSPLLDAKYTLAGGYDVRIGNPAGLHLGGRSIWAYAAFDPDEEAYLDSIGAATGERTGGKATTFDTGVDLMLGYSVGPVSAHAFYGIHYYRDYFESMTLDTDQGEFEFSGRSRRDFGPSLGFGVTLGLVRGQGLFAEWYRGGGQDAFMREMEGFRFGLYWGW